jgi:hypothetical protein
MSISLYRGDSGLIQCNVKSSLTTLEGADIVFTVRREEDSTVALTKSIGSGVLLTDPSTFTVAIDAGDTAAMLGRYIYDIEMTLGGNVYTRSKDAFAIAEDVTHTS